MKKRFIVIPYLRDSEGYLLTAEEISQATGVDLRRVKNTLQTAAVRGSVIKTSLGDKRFWTHSTTLAKIHNRF